MSKKPKEPTWPQHSMGTRCGYQLFEDGSIQPARAYSVPLDDLNDREAAARDLMGHITDHCSRLLEGIAKERRRIFTSMCEDYGIDLNDNHVSYSSYANRLRIQRKERGDDV